MDKKAKYQDQIDEISKQIVKEPDNVELYRKRADLFFGKEQIENALNDYNKILEINPKNVDVLLFRGRLLIALDSFDNAIVWFNRVLKIDANNNEAKEELGKIYFQKKEYEKALEYFKDIDRELDKEIVEKIEEISNYYLSKGEYDKAREACYGYSDILELRWWDLGYPLHEHLQFISDVQLKGVKEKKLSVFEIRKAKREAKEEAQKEMLSFFTHTLNNALGTGDNTIQDIIMDFESDKYINNKDKNINRLNSLFANFSLIRSLIKSYKIYIQDPEYFKTSWVKDSSGDANIDWVFVYTLRQVISQLLFINDPKILNRLQMGAGNFNNKEEMKKENQRIRKSFINDVLLTKINKVNISEILSWFTINLPFIKLEIKAPKLNFGIENIRFGLFFACFSEIINNALKYSDGKAPIELKWEEDSKYYIFQSRNTYNSETSFSNDIKEIKSQKGIHFIERLMNLFADSKIKSSELVKIDVDDNYFIFSVKYPKNKMN